MNKTKDSNINNQSQPTTKSKHRIPHKLIKGKEYTLFHLTSTKTNNTLIPNVPLNYTQVSNKTIKPIHCSYQHQNINHSRKITTNSSHKTCNSNPAQKKWTSNLPLDLTKYNCKNNKRLTENTKSNKKHSKIHQIQ